MKIEHKVTGSDEHWEYGERWVDGHLVSRTMKLINSPPPPTDEQLWLAEMKRLEGAVAFWYNRARKAEEKLDERRTEA